ncbi:MAG: hypothetical protein HC892_09170 [Saprospiraceae bacterium]|nr:hypothetical protein [Saprospiraceae bacterium]
MGKRHYKNCRFILSNLLPIAAEYWDDAQQAFYVIMAEIKLPLSEFKLKKALLENAWQEVKTTKSMSTVEGFLSLYPYSKYQTQAKKRKNELLEEQLWQKALLQPTIENLLEYSKSAPFKHHRNEALDKIISIEKNHDTAWKDAEINQTIAFFFDYKSRFPDGEHVEKAEKYLAELLSLPLDTQLNPKQLDQIFDEEATPKKYLTQGYGLTYLAYQTLSAEEMLSYELLSEYIERVDAKLSEAAFKLSNWLTYLRLGVASLILMVLAYLGLSYLNGFYGTQTEVILYYLLPLSIFGFVIYLLINLISQINSDASFCEKEQHLSERKNIDLKIAFITHDKKNIRAALIALWDIEQRADELIEKRLSAYLFVQNKMIYDR